jgi:LmbE family N-acetylglucosaminyl deacetylase
VVTPGHRTWARLLRRARPLSAAAAARDGWLVLAPHPDDEVLGTGGLLAALGARRARITVAFLTDGSASHVGAPGWSPRRIAAARTAEAAAAMRILGLRDPAVHLGWRDAAPVPAGSAAWKATVRRVVALCRRHRLTRIVTSWEGDPHCDHEAAAQLAREVAHKLGVQPSFYAVWGWTRIDVDQRLAGFGAVALSVSTWQGRQRRALDVHRTQLGSRIPKGTARFVLPRPMRRLVDRTHLLLLKEPRHAS